MTTDWREDARFVGAFIRGGSWEVGLRIARRVQPGAGQGTSSRSGQGDRISLRDFAAAAYVSTTTISTYYKAWELAADDGRVEHSANLTPDDEYLWDAEGLHEDDWKLYYRQVSGPAPEPKWENRAELPSKPRTPAEINRDKIDAELTINPNRSDARIAKTLGLTDKEVASRRKALGIEPFEPRTPRDPNPAERRSPSEEPATTADAPNIDWASLPGTAAKKLEVMRRQVRRELEAEFDVWSEVNARVAGARNAMRVMQENARKILDGRKGVFTRGEWKEILFVTHPDTGKSVSDEQRANVFRLLNEADILLLNEKNRPTPSPRLPTLDELRRKRPYPTR